MADMQDKFDLAKSLGSSLPVTSFRLKYDPRRYQVDAQQLEEEKQNQDLANAIFDYQRDQAAQTAGGPQVPLTDLAQEVAQAVRQAQEQGFKRRRGGSQNGF